jgi:ElaA protein
VPPAASRACHRTQSNNSIAMPEITWHWQRFEELGVKNLYDALQLRSKVFIIEQGPYLDPDGADDRSWHLLGRDEKGELHAYLRAVDPGVKYAEPSIGRVVTSLAVRGKGVGRRLMEKGLECCQGAWPGNGIRISAQARLVPFYRSLGFDPVGEEYLEDGIPHIEMLRSAR